MSSALQQYQYQSTPLIEYEERHGGPLWYKLCRFSMEFREGNLVNITLDRTMSKNMSPQSNPVSSYRGNYQIMVDLPHILTGRITLEGGRHFHFESIQENRKFLILEQPPFWKASIILEKLHI